jgi:hypothetical protein
MRSRLILATLLVMSACSAVDANLEVRPGQVATTSPSASPSPTPKPSPDEPEAAPPFAPGPRSKLPRRAGALASKLETVTGALQKSIPRWRRGDKARPPEVVVLQTLYQQRIYRLMAKRSELGRRTLRRLDGMLARTSRDIMSAFRLLRSLVTPLKPGFTFKTGRFKPAADLLRFYKRAKRRFGVGWQVLAAVNYVETKFGRVKSTSTAGAQGPMQFLPSTWAAYGLGGNIKDDRDAIMGAANYLRSSGASKGPSGLRRALYAYNHSGAYVRAVLNLARDMRRRPDHYYWIYNWQVFVATTKGDKRLTGPGL